MQSAIVGSAVNKALADARQDKPALVPFPDLQKVTGWNLDYLYEAAKRPDLPFEVRRYGRRLYVTRESLERWLTGQETVDPAWD